MAAGSTEALEASVDDSSGLSVCASGDSVLSTGVASVAAGSGLLGDSDPADEDELVSSVLDTGAESVELSTSDDSVSDSVTAGAEVVEGETLTDPADEEINSASVTASGSEVVEADGRSVESSSVDPVSVDGFKEPEGSSVTSCPDPSSADDAPSVINSTWLPLDSVTEAELSLDADSGMTVVAKSSSSSHSKTGQHLSGEKMGRQFGMWLGFSSHSTMTQRMMDDSQVQDCWQGLGTGTSAPFE